MNWVYDIETLKNCFTAVFEDADSEETREFVIHESRDDSQALIDFLTSVKRSGAGLTGFNNLHFDWIVLDFLYNMPSSITGSGVIAEMLYSKVQEIIRTKERIYAKEWIPQLDLYLVNHYDNKNRSTSLKALQVAMRWHFVQDMPIEHSSEVSEEMIEEVLRYNRNDVKSTKNFLKMNADKISLRKAMGKKFRQNFINKGDVPMGEAIFIKYLANKMGTSPSNVRRMRSQKTDVPIERIIFPYVQFQTPKFQLLLRQMQGSTMGRDQLKDFASKVDSAGLGVDEVWKLFDDAQMPTRQPAQSKLKKSFSFSHIYNGIKFDYGIGGVHACIRPGIYREDDEYQITDIDVKSYYPNISIRNGLKPRHFPKDFVEVYEYIFDQRLQAQKDGDKVMSDGLKLSLNGVFGKTLDTFSCMFDPFFFAGIVVNGQLMMTMLAEMLVEKLTGAQLLQVNTDGLTIKYLRSERSMVDNVCQWWEGLTKLTLEYQEYKSMFIRDVNNYLGVYVDGKVKQKGAFEVIKEWHKDPSFAVIPLAVNNYFIHGTPIMETLEKHTDLYDFCGRYKATPGFKAYTIYLHNDRETWDDHGKILRYIPVRKGRTAIKQKKQTGGIFNLLEGYQVEPMNEFHEVDKSNIDYQFFQVECTKLIESVKSPQTEIF